MFGRRAHVWKAKNGEWKWAVYKGSRQVGNSGETYTDKNYTWNMAVEALGVLDTDAVGSKRCWVPTHDECQVLVRL